MRTFSLISILVFLLSCRDHNYTDNTQKARQLFSEGKTILKNRIKIQYSDTIKAAELNNQAIEKFAAAYETDTLFADAVLFASECTMYARNYKECIYWTSKLIRIDTTRRNVDFCTDRLKFCEEQLRLGLERRL